MPNPTSPLITLTTDFGLQDPFVGTMKGVIAGICPEARVIDVTHGVARFHILDGAIKLWQSARFFPSGTIHVAVVDPGVGSERRPLLAKIGEQWFIAPDNGLLSWVLNEAVTSPSGTAMDFSAWQLENTKYFLPELGHTFHGRDIFAPAAAHLARGADPESFGKRIVERGKSVTGNAPLIQLENTRAIRIADRGWLGNVLLADHFGNLLTNFRRQDIPEDLSGWKLEVAGKTITAAHANYAAGADGEPFAIFGSSGLLEIAVNRGNAERILGAPAGATVRLSQKA
jgi:S-adenosyl-L-methionine hydrolase (adenosine-forming)